MSSVSHAILLIQVYFTYLLSIACLLTVQSLKLIQRTRRSSSPLSPRTSLLTRRKSFKSYDDGGLVDDDDDDDGDEILEFERKIR